MYRIIELNRNLERNVLAILIGMTREQAKERLQAYADEKGKYTYLTRYDPNRPDFFDIVIETARPKQATT